MERHAWYYEFSSSVTRSESSWPLLSNKKLHLLNDVNQNTTGGWSANGALNELINAMPLLDGNGCYDS